MEKVNGDDGGKVLDTIMKRVEYTERISNDLAVMAKRLNSLLFGDEEKNGEGCDVKPNCYIADVRGKFENIEENLKLVESFLNLL